MEVVKETHAALGAYTSTPKLTAFIKGHLDPNYTVARADVADKAVVTMAEANVTGGKAVVHKIRKRLKAEFGTVRPPRACDQLAPMPEPECAELLRLLHPLYLC